MTSSDRPIHLHYFSSIDYGFLMQRPQQLYRHWASLRSNQFDVTYVEPLRPFYARRPSMHQDPGVKRLRTYLPFRRLGLDRLEVINRELLLHALGAHGTRAVRRVAVVCSPAWEPYVRPQDFDQICYDYLDAIEVHAGTADFATFKCLHERLAHKSDLVFVTAERLREDIAGIDSNKPVITVSNGVDVSQFQNARSRLDVRRVLGLHGPVVGYLGAVFEWIDLDLVFQAARHLQDVQFLMVGPIGATHDNALAGKPKNVLFTGPKPYCEVPAYIDAFDVALIPFKRGEIANATDPIKLYEYFALGKPVVATHMAQLERYNDGQMLRMAGEAEPFCEAVRAALDNMDCKVAERRKAVALQNTWSAKASLMLDAIRAFTGTAR